MHDTVSGATTIYLTPFNSSVWIAKIKGQFSRSRGKIISPKTKKYITDVNTQMFKTNKQEVMTIIYYKYPMLTVIVRQANGIKNLPGRSVK